MGVLKGDLETQNPQHEELTLHNAVPQRPEVGVQLQGLTARVKVPSGEVTMVTAARKVALRSP